MMMLATAWLACVALFLELAERAPTLDPTFEPARLPGAKLSQQRRHTRS